MVKPRGDGKNEMDPEMIMRKKFRAKCRFKACGRLVLANAYWLIEDVDQYEGFDDVKRRVEQAVRAKGKKQLLSVKDKALLNKPAADRSEIEKRYIYRIIGGLKCFKRYPNLMTQVVPAGVEVVDSGVQVDVAYFEFRKAFDTVDNNILLVMLAHAACTPQKLFVFPSYMRNRHQVVGWSCQSSKPYITCLLFADDLKLVREIRGHADCGRLQADIDSVV